MTLKTRTISLNIPRLGGVQEFRLTGNQELHRLGRKVRYVCSTWPEDGLDNGSLQYDIFRFTDKNNMCEEYLALLA